MAGPVQQLPRGGRRRGEHGVPDEQECQRRQLGHADRWHPQRRHRKRSSVRPLPADAIGSVHGSVVRRLDLAHAARVGQPHVQQLAHAVRACAVQQGLAGGRLLQVHHVARHEYPDQGNVVGGGFCHRV